MRYQIRNLAPRRQALGFRRRPRLGEGLMRVDQLWLRYGLLFPPSGFESQWGTCDRKVQALAPSYDSSSPQGQDAIACINALMVAMGRQNEIIDMTPVPPPGTCTDQGVRLVEATGGYSALTCPTGDDCHNVIDGPTGKVLIRDVKGAVSPNPICAKWGFGPDPSGAGTGAAGGGQDPWNGMVPSSGGGTPQGSGTQGGTGLPAKPSTSSPATSTPSSAPDKSALLGAGVAGLLGVVLALSKGLR